MLISILAWSIGVIATLNFDNCLFSAIHYEVKIALTQSTDIKYTKGLILINLTQKALDVKNRMDFLQNEMATLSCEIVDNSPFKVQISGKYIHDIFSKITSVCPIVFIQS